MIRPATAGDLPQLIEVSLASFGSITWQRAIDREFGPLNGLDWRARWRIRVARALREQMVLVLEENGRIAGCAWGTLDREFGLGHIDVLAVDPAFQNRGLGRRLLRAMEDHLRSEGATHVQLESLDDNAAANALYRKDGYKPLARHFNWVKKL